MRYSTILSPLSSLFQIRNSRSIYCSLTHKMDAEETCIVAVCQLTCTNDKEKNLNSVKNLVQEAVQKDAKIVFLPEACDYVGSNSDETKALAEPLDGFLMTEYKSLARDNDVWLSVGGFHEIVKNSGAENKYHVTHVLINSKGIVEAVYRKLHLFDISLPNVKLKESDNVTPGNEIVPPVNTPAGPLGLSICYDVRFPEKSLILRKQGANILTFPSAFTKTTGQAHWETLLRARAIDNQCYVVAAAQYGCHNAKRTSYGQAMIIDPWGKILAECPKFSEDEKSNESVAIAAINKNVVQKIRSEMPVFEHRRNDLYAVQSVSGKQFLRDDEQTTFKFGQKEIPSLTVFYRTMYSFAFTNIRCVVPGHVLISSIRQVPRLVDLNPEEISDLFTTAIKVQKVMEKVHGASSSTICVQDGQDAGQTVAQVHCHILPRKPGDFDRNDDVYSELAKHDRDNNLEPLRSVEEMSEEAELLRPYF